MDQRKRIVFFAMAFVVSTFVEVPSLCAQAIDRMAIAHHQGHESSLKLGTDDKRRATAIFDAYTEDTELLQRTRATMWDFCFGFPTEEWAGVPPKDLNEDELPLALLVDRFVQNAQPRFEQLIAALNMSYFEQLRVLVPDRSLVVDSLERAWRRERQLKEQTWIPGAGIDLIRVLAQALPDWRVRAPLRDLMDSWEEQTNALLVRYETLDSSFRETRSQALLDARAGLISIEEAVEITASRSVLQSRIWTLTERTHDQLISLLDEGESSDFQRKWRETKYPFVWRRGTTASGELTLLCEQTTTKLDRLQRDAFSERAIREHQLAWTSWYVDPNRSKYPPENIAEEAFNDAGRQFVDSVANKAPTEDVSPALNLDASEWTPTSYADHEYTWLRYQLVPDWTPEALESCLASVGDITPDQRLVIETMHEDYLRAFRDRSNAYRMMWVEADAQRKHPDATPWRFRPRTSSREAKPYDPTVQLSWQMNRPIVEDGFTRDIAAVLDDEQRETWESWARRLRREREFPEDQKTSQGWSSFSVCDLIRVVESLEVTDSEREPLQDALLTFEIQVDRILNEIDNRMSAEDLQCAIGEMADPNRKNPETTARRQRYYEDRATLRNQLIEVCLTTFDQVEALLPEHVRSEFQVRAGRYLWSNVYLRTPAEMAFELLGSCPSIQDDRKVAIEQVQERYIMLRSSLYARMVREQRQAHANPPGPESYEEIRAEYQAFRLAVQADRNQFRVMAIPWAEPWRQRFMLNLKTCRDIRHLFTDDEVAQLPAALQMILSPE